MRIGVLLVLGVFAGSVSVTAQHPDDHQAAPDAHHHHVTTEAEAPASRDASGTSWLPDDTPMFGFHRPVAGWDLMLHGNAFVQYLHESGEEHRRGHQVGSINWFMATASRAAAGGRVELRSMVSLEPWTIRGCGYPSLLATGEICNGDNIHDKQHPHDLFMEMAANNDRPLTRSIRWQIYGGPAGEPALGPTPFPHRLSAAVNPLAPIAHHWLDATHITFGVFTAGVYGRQWKIEASAFNGREPDDRRTGFDLGPLDSVSLRLAFAPSRTLSVQVSAGHLKDAEAGVGSQPATSVDRATASLSYHRSGPGGIWATTAAWGRNSQTTIIPDGLIHQATQAALLETAILRRTGSWFGRAELAGKPAHDLHIHEYITQTFEVGKLQVGYVRNLRVRKGLLPGIGGTVSASLLPSLLAPRYGGRVAPGFGIFATIRAAEHRMPG